MDLQPLGRISDFDGFLLPKGQHQAITWRGFESHDAEHVYRVNHLERDRFHGTLFVLATLILTLLGGFLAAGPFPSLAAIVVRLMLFGAGIVAMSWLRRTTLPRRFDQVLGGFVVATVSGTAYLFHREGGVIATVLLVTLVGFVVFVLPMAWHIRGVAGLCLSVVYVVSIVRSEVDHVPLVVLGVLPVLTIVGTLLAYEAGRWRRQRFLTFANEVRLRAELEQLLATNKSLPAILSACAHCRRVRNAHGHWVMLDRYLREQSSVKISHGICDDCLAQHHPDQCETR